MIGGAVGDAEGRCGGEVGIVGDGLGLIGIQQRLLGERPERGSGHPLPRNEPGAFAGGDDLAGDLIAGNERRRNLHLIFAGDEQYVGEVDRGRADPNQQLAGAGHRVGHLVEHQVLRCAVGTADDRPHQRTPSPRKQNRTTWAMSSGAGCCAEPT